ncbi:unnamed protein product [Paramecium pentaurelia]|uniref:Protein kinase domain-containing protein n=1 Tax=Paramecium pentaurelia TaxID=43138 RepID=A0A8S1U1W5_9CILI|nr:unnamed protein product [Paramecium pentaurelia]
MMNQLTVNDYQINLDSILGSGSQGSIFNCLKKSTNEQIVAKITKVNQINANTIDREIAIVNQIKNKQNVSNLVKMYDIVIVEYNGGKILVEFMEKCDSDLGKLIKEYKSKKESFTFDQVVDFAGQIIRGYSHLNALNIIHRDLKPENILITKKNDKLDLKITDFGVGKVLTNDYAITNTGTPIYSAPELSCSDQVYNSKSDIFSLGVILYQLVYNNEIPFKIDGRNIQKVKLSLKTQPIKCQYKQGFEDQFLDLIDKMLLYSPDERISWDQLENAPYFKNYFPEKFQFPSQKQQKQLHLFEYIIAVYYQTSKIIQIIEKLPKNFIWQFLSIILTKYILLNFQNELIQMILSIKNNKQQLNKSIVTVNQQQVDQNEIKQVLEKQNILTYQSENENQIIILKQEIKQQINDQQDHFFQDFYQQLIQLPEDQSMFDFWHLKFQVVYKTYIRQWISKYMVEKSISLTEAYLLEKFSYFLEEYPKTSYNNFNYNQIHSKIISQDQALEYLKQKQLI